MEYLNFDLVIGTGSRRQYPVSVIYSPAGEVPNTTMYFPFRETELKNLLNDLQTSLFRSGATYRQVPSQKDSLVQDFGRSLFDNLFLKDVRSCYDASLEEARRQNKGLRLRLHIQDPELATLPWEFLYDSRGSEFMSLSSNTPIIRYLDLPRIQPLKVNLPIQILGMVACPSDLEDSLDVEREKELMHEAVENLEKNGLVKLTWLLGKTWQDLQQAMRRGPWHIFHFIGHGGFDNHLNEGYIALEKDNGQSYQLSASQLSRVLTDHRLLMLAILNTCEGARGNEYDVFSSTAATLIQRGISSVIAMQYPITDYAAIEFARSFYKSLADEWPVDASVAEARKSISLSSKKTLEWGIPVLYTRSPDGALFDIGQKNILQSNKVVDESSPLQPPNVVLPQINGVLKSLHAHLRKEFTNRDRRKALVDIVIQDFNIDAGVADLIVTQLINDGFIEQVGNRYQLTDKAKSKIARGGYYA